MFGLRCGSSEMKTDEIFSFLSQQHAAETFLRYFTIIENVKKEMPQLKQYEVYLK